MNRMSESRQFCTFFLADLCFGVSVQQVQEVIRWQDMTRVPLAPVARARRWWQHVGAWRATVATADHRWLYFGVFAMGLWLAAPPPWGVWRVMYWMPGLNFVRAPSRFTVVGILGLGLVAAAGLEWLMRGRRPAMRVAIASIVRARSACTRRSPSTSGLPWG